MTLLLIVVFTMAITAPVYAEGWDDTSREKFKTGVKTIAKSPLQISKSISEEYDVAKFKPFGIAVGLLKGLFYFVKDIGSGLVDVLTFNVDYP